MCKEEKFVKFTSIGIHFFQLIWVWPLGNTRKLAYSLFFSLWLCSISRQKWIKEKWPNFGLYFQRDIVHPSRGDTASGRKSMVAETILASHIGSSHMEQTVNEKRGYAVKSQGVPVYSLPLPRILLSKY